MRLHSIVVAASLLVGLAGPPAAARQADPKALAKKHFEKGELYYQQGDFRKALEEYKTAQQSFRHPAFIFNIAQCHRQLREWEQALFFYQLYLSEAPGATNKAEVDQRIKEAKAKLEEAKTAAQQLGRISVITRPEGASIRLDQFSGPAVAQSPAIVPASAGQHLVLVEKEGYEKVHRTVTVISGQIAMLELTLVPKPGGAVTPPPREDPRVTPPPREDPRVTPPPREDPRVTPPRPREDPRRAAPQPPREGPRRFLQPIGDGVGPRPLRKPFYKTWWFWTGVGGTVVLGVVGSMTGVAALANHADYVDNGIPSELNRATRLALITDSAFVLAGAAAITTIIVTAVYEKRRKAERPAALVIPSCGPTGCGIALTGRF